MKKLEGILVAAEITRDGDKLSTFKCDDFFPTGGNYVIVGRMDWQKAKDAEELAKEHTEHLRKLCGGNELLLDQFEQTEKDNATLLAALRDATMCSQLSGVDCKNIACLACITMDNIARNAINKQTGD